MQWQLRLSIVFYFFYRYSLNQLNLFHHLEISSYMHRTSAQFQSLTFVTVASGSPAYCFCKCSLKELDSSNKLMVDIPWFFVPPTTKHGADRGPSCCNWLQGNKVTFPTTKWTFNGILSPQRFHFLRTTQARFSTEIYHETIFSARVFTNDIWRDSRVHSNKTNFSRTAKVNIATTKELLTLQIVRTSFNQNMDLIIVYIKLEVNA